jgi:hypothetical protein
VSLSASLRPASPLAQEGRKAAVSVTGIGSRKAIDEYLFARRIRVFWISIGDGVAVAKKPVKSGPL